MKRERSWGESTSKLRNNTGKEIEMKVSKECVQTVPSADTELSEESCTA